ncbi:MAG: hypothetical protein DRP18_01865 [Candidatus Aenigmatarchaeota archaeon]|nr:MAG: hypothetical protein DRP18_01865 [Candidatus Aenigmarchaeota archaeon]
MSLNIKDVLEEPVKLSGDDTVGVAAAKMTENERDYVFVFDNGMKGIVLARDLIKRTIDPEKTKLETFIKHISPLDIDTPVTSIIEKIMVNDYLVVPVCFENEIYALTKIGLLNALRENEVLKGKKAMDVMKFPYCVSEDDSASVVRNIMKNLEISRMPVLDEKGKLAGLVNCIDLLKTIAERKRAKKGDMRMEKTKMDVPVSSFMRKVFPRAGPETPLNKVIELMVKNYSAVVIEDNGELKGIVTPRNILKLFGKKTEGVYVNISGLKDIDAFLKNIIDKQITNSVKKLSKIVTINYAVFRVSKHKKAGKRTKYSVRAGFSTNRGRFFVKDYDWDVTKAMGNVLDKIERMIVESAKR